ncbi:MAG: tryptophan 2,3-dioxygenase [Acidimicrobiales bacterium]
MAEDFTYGQYLRLAELLALQHPISRPVHHDELLFIIQHQTSELWFRLVLHELRAVAACLAADDPRPAFKAVARVKTILHALTDQWAVLGTLTPADYAGFRADLGSSSGFQSYQYRALEFALGHKDRQAMALAEADPTARALLADALGRPSVYDEFLRFLARAGHAVPAEILERDVTGTYRFTPALVPVLRRVYEHTHEHWEAYEACEELVDLEDSFQLWRFRHVQTVERIIGTKPGTGGSAGVGYLRSVVDRRFFPELFAVRAEIGNREAEP